MKRVDVNELLTYTKNRRILRLLFLYNNEELLINVLNIYKKLINSNRSDSQKSDLVVMYIKNRKRNHIDYLICNSQMLDLYTFIEQKEIIKQYLSYQIKYEQIVNNCYMKSMNLHVENSKNTETEILKREKIIARSASIITSNKSVLKYRTNEEIYNLVKVYYEDHAGVLINLIVNENILKYRNNHEQIKLLKLYLEHPIQRVYDLIVNNLVLHNMNLHDQLKLIDLYLDNQTEDMYYKISGMLLKNKSYKEIEDYINKDVKKYKNILFKKENK